MNLATKFFCLVSVSVWQLTSVAGCSCFCPIGFPFLCIHNWHDMMRKRSIETDFQEKRFVLELEASLMDFPPSNKNKMFFHDIDILNIRYPIQLMFWLNHVTTRNNPNHTTFFLGNCEVIMTISMKHEHCQIFTTFFFFLKMLEIQTFLQTTKSTSNSGAK